MPQWLHGLSAKLFNSSQGALAMPEILAIGILLMALPVIIYTMFNLPEEEDIGDEMHAELKSVQELLN